MSYSRGTLFTEFLKYGPWGLLLAFAAYTVPDVVTGSVTGYKTHREQNREDAAANSTSWERYALHLEQRVADSENEANARIAVLLNANAELEAENIILRAADQLAPVAVWTLDEKLDVDDFNDVFYNLILAPHNITREDAKSGKNWLEIFAAFPTVARSYYDTDAEVRRTRVPFSDETLYTLDAAGNRTYWRVIKWAVVIDGIFKRLKGVASPIRTVIGGSSKNSNQ